MIRKFCGRLLVCLGMGWLLTALSLSAVADPPGKGKGKSEARGNIVQVDLDQLPPGLAAKVREAAGAVKGVPDQPKGKSAKGAPSPAKGKAAAVPLPPGLARKPANHPGRLNFLKQHAAGKKPKGPDKKPEKKGESSEESDDAE